MAYPRFPAAAVGNRLPKPSVAARRNARVVQASLARQPQCVVGTCGEKPYADGLCRLHHLRRLAAIPLQGLDFRGVDGMRSRMADDALSLIYELLDHGWSWGRLSELFAMPARVMQDYVAANDGAATCGPEFVVHQS